MPMPPNPIKRIYFDENVSQYYAAAFNLFEKTGKEIHVLSTAEIFYGYELDKDYFDASVKRFNQYKSQLILI